MSDQPTRTLPPAGDPTSDAPANAPQTASDDGSRHTLLAPDGPPGTCAAHSPPGFELLAEVGRGGMGVVYRARDIALNRDVAVKILQERYPADGPAARRFVEESQITSQLQHPGIPPIHLVSALPGGRPFLVMKLIKGSTLDQLLAERADPAEDRGRFLAVFEQVCLAVGYAHGNGVIHRDLKPSNVMVGKYGEVQVMDWGLAKVVGVADVVGATAADPAATAVRSVRELGSETVAGSVLGTPSFMPPEQAGGEIERIDTRSDVFALGGVLCAILTGKPPYTGKDTNEITLKAVRGQTAEALARLDVCGAEPELVSLAKRCLATDSADRPADGGEAAKAVAEFRAQTEARARHAELERVRAEGELRAAESKAAEQRKRRKVQLALFGTVALLVFAAGAFAWWEDKQATAARNEEERRKAAERAEEDRRKALTERELTAALAEMNKLCDRGDKEIDNPPRWRLTLASARSAQRRGASALDAGPASDELREKFTAATARLDRDEYDCETAELCEKWVGVLFESVGRTDEEGLAAGLNDLTARVEEIFARLGTPLATTAPETVARVVRGHRLRYPATFIAAFLGHPGRGGGPGVVDRPGARLGPLSKLLLAEPGEFFAEIRKAASLGETARLERLLESPEGRAIPPRGLLLLYFAAEPPRSHPPIGKQFLLDEAIQRDPTDILPLFIRAGTVHGSLFRPLGKDGQPELLQYRARVLLACGAAVSLRPDVPELWALYARNLELEDFRDWAANCYRRAIELDPTRGYDHVSLARLLIEMGRVAEGVELYRTTFR